ncbi:MAG TPA: GYD domain-containing protein, partial [Chloroflexota bacterium]
LKQRWGGQGNPQEQAKQRARELGCEVKATYLTMGRYDLVTIIEAPNDEVMAKLALSAGMQGTFQTETLRAYNEEETARLIQSLV